MVEEEVRYFYEDNKDSIFPYSIPLKVLCVQCYAPRDYKNNQCIDCKHNKISPIPLSELGV